jgi:CRP-like cAMP-binding protein
MHTLRRPPAAAPADRFCNGLLAAWPDAEWARLAPELTWVAVAQGQVLYEAGAPLKHVYFPATAVVSLVSTLRSGASVEVAMVGHEGLVGISAFMGSGTAYTSAVVQAPGHAWRVGAPMLAQHVRGAEPVMHLMLGYTQALLAHMAQTSACHCHHGLDQQLCRWLLLHLDRQDHDQVRSTQERIAAMLGVRREGVTVGALKLQKAGLIRYVRGRIDVLDRAGLEALSCECYAVVKDVYDRLRGQQPPPRTCAVEQTPQPPARMLGVTC